jgi:hypothetical protein
MHVLFGTYDLLKLRNANGQLGSRAITVHFNRYRPDSSADLNDFADALLSLAAYMPLHEMPDLRKDLDYCFNISLGLVGLLKVWLADTLGSVLESGRRTVSRNDLEKNEPPIDVLENISKEIVDGERKLKQDERKRSLVRLRMLTGAEYIEPLPSQEDGRQREEPIVKPEENADGDNPPSSATYKKTKKRRSRVERNPKRDKVGAGRKRDAA